MSRDYVGWYKLKTDIEKNRIAPDFSERDVWWCSIGANIGYEQDGKHDKFERPVLVVRKFSKELFIGMPLTTRERAGKFYYAVNTGDENSVVILSQARTLSSKRLDRKMGRVGESDFVAIIKKWHDLTKKSDPANARSSDANGDLYSNNSKHEQKSQDDKEVKS